MEASPWPAPRLLLTLGLKMDEVVLAIDHRRAVGWQQFS
jgi:hypothetical protein